jgi:DNA-binding transcriptional ArsR family regulator
MNYNGCGRMEIMTSSKERNIHDCGIKDILILDRPEDIKLVFSEKYNNVLKLIGEKEMSISDMARSLNINPGSVHYYLKGLERHGLVTLVREEITGSIVRKYYRAVAKRILLDIPDFKMQNVFEVGNTQDYEERLIKSIEYLGYVLPDENIEDAIDLLHRYTLHMKDLTIDMDYSGLENVEDNGMILKNALNLILGIKIKNDPALARIYSEFEKLFLPYG